MVRPNPDRKPRLRAPDRIHPPERDGSAQCASKSAGYLFLHRTSAPPPCHTVNMKAHIGSLAGKAARALPDRDVSPLKSDAAPFYLSGSGSRRALRKSSRKARCKLSYVWLAQFVRPMMTRSYPGRTEIFRAASRRRLFSRLRTTALPSRFPTTKPNRLYSRWLGSTRKRRTGCDHRRPFAYTAENSAFLRIRFSWANSCERELTPTSC